MEKRNSKEMAQTREDFYNFLKVDVEEGIKDYEYLGRANEGMVFVNPQGLSVVVKVITKAIDFDYNEVVEDFENKAIAKAQALSKKNGSVKVIKKAKVGE